MKDFLIIFGAKYLIAIIVLIAAWFFFKQEKAQQKQIFLFALFVLPISYLVAKISSLFYYDARPFVTGPPAGGFTPLIAHVADNGFPSDHTLLSSAVAATVFFFNKKIGAALFLLAILVGASRVLAGVHHSVDIIGSLIISSVVAMLVYKFSSIVKKEKK